MALTKIQHTVEFSKNKHTPSRTTFSWTAPGQLVQSTERDAWCQLADPHSTAPVSQVTTRGSSAPTRYGCPSRLGCRSALPRVRTNLGRCQSSSPVVLRNFTLRGGCAALGFSSWSTTRLAPPCSAWTPRCDAAGGCFVQFIHVGVSVQQSKAAAITSGQLLQWAPSSVAIRLAIS